jgi:hypothetical protein
VTGTGASQNGFPKVPDTMPDGTSQTILFAERYANNLNGGTGWCYPYDDTSYAWPAFASRIVGPGKVPSGAVTTDSRFLWEPNPWSTKCDGRWASTGHSAGMNACMGDASVRVVGYTVSSPTWWCACTPNAKDVLGPDW